MPVSLHGVPHLSSVSLIILSASLPFLFRFFIRSLTAYQNLLRANNLQRQAWALLAGQYSWDAYRLYVELYWEKRLTPQKLRSVIWQNLKYGFFWVFAVAVGAIAWAFATSVGVSGRVTSAGILLVGLGWEAITLRSYRQHYWTGPNQEQLDQLAGLQRTHTSSTPL